MSVTWSFGTIFKIFIWGYFIGGITLLPIVVVLGWYLITTPISSEHLLSSSPGGNSQLTQGQLGENELAQSSNGKNTEYGLGLDDSIIEKLKGKNHAPDVFAGYFAVCREYVPGGVNGKPPDRTSPASAMASVESPSVYQSMYRSIFDRNKTSSPTIDSTNARNRRTRNVFYVVLRLGHLMLYDSEDQLEVRHVISLAHYNIAVYAGGKAIPEGELWIKRNCICLSQMAENESHVEGRTYYLFSDNCSEKEDLYHAMLQAQEHHRDDSKADLPPIPLKFDIPDLVKLAQQLHASEENLHTRWINALIGRLFLALYKTEQIREFIAKKINKKIARVPKPAIISSVELRKIDTGTLPPFITNPKLKELTVDGDLVVEGDVTYRGNFRIEISATARIDLGARFKAREVTIILATVLKKLDGHVLIRVKPPPSNRLWISFEVPPKMELSLEPIVSSRQITYGVVLRAIENRIREVLNETLVLPNWDDVPFTDTMAQLIRGGIWEDENKGQLEDLNLKQDDTVLKSAIADAEKLDANAEASPRPSISSSIGSEDTGIGASTSIDLNISSVKARITQPGSARSSVNFELDGGAKDDSSDSLSKAATSTNPLPINIPAKSRSDGRSEISGGSSVSSSDDISTASMLRNTNSATPPRSERNHSPPKLKDLSLHDIATAAAAAAGATNMTKKAAFNQSFNSATAAARNWLISKQGSVTPKTGNLVGTRDGPSNTKLESDDKKDQDADEPLETPNSIAKPYVEPIGRGKPLPPPGTPLPVPKMERKQTWTLPTTSTFANLAKRKGAPLISEGLMDSPTAPHNLPKTAKRLQTPSIQQTETATGNEEEIFKKKPQTSQEVPSMVAPMKSSAASPTGSAPPTSKRRQRQQSLQMNLHSRRISREMEIEPHLPEGLLVVEAPVAEPSAPSSPVETKDEKAEGSKANVGKRDKDVKGESMIGMMVDNSVI